MAFLVVEDIHKRYEGDLLLEGITFSMERGEILSLLGPSGSGKTTLLRIIAGLEPCEAGRIVLDGRDVTRMPVHRRGVVLMFQEYALFPHRTVAENVAFGLRMKRLAPAAIETRVREMLSLVGLEGFGPRDVVALSGGERQRVALARSLAPEPRLLLLDEPLGSLDRTLRERLMGELAAILQRVGVTAISVTHDQAEAFAVADRVALLHEAGIVQIGRPEEIYRAPATPWVARFLGFDNLLPARTDGPGRIDTELGALVAASGTPLPDTGVEGTLLILPWGIRLVDGGHPLKGHSSEGRDRPPNTFTATVRRRVFQGATTKLQLEVGGATLTLALEMGGLSPREGDVVHGWIKPESLRWFQSPPDGASSGTTHSQS